MLSSSETPEFHLLALAGGAKNLVSPAHENDLRHVFCVINSVYAPTVLSCIDFRFHERLLNSPALYAALSGHRNPIVLTTHVNCGAYGGSEPFENDAAKEAAFHCDQLRIAKDTLNYSEVVIGSRDVEILHADASLNAHPDAHACDALVFSCCEPACWPRAFSEVPERLGIGSFDILTSYGGAKNMAGRWEDPLLRNIEISRKLHDIKTVVIVGHGHGRCGMTQADLKRAAQRIASAFGSDLRVATEWL